MGMLNDWLDSAAQYSPDDTKAMRALLAGNTMTCTVVEALVELYAAQNDAIHRFAEEKNIHGLDLAGMESLWIEDPDGEKRFFREFGQADPERWRLVSANFTMLAWMLFQGCWMYNPTRAYLIRCGRKRDPVPEDFFSKEDCNPETLATGRLRKRFAPLGVAV